MECGGGPATAVAQPSPSAILALRMRILLPVDGLRERRQLAIGGGGGQRLRGDVARSGGSGKKLGVMWVV